MTDSIHVDLTEKSLEVLDVVNAINDPAHGAQVLFVGVVRDNNVGKAVRAVSYDAFVPLARATLLQICQEARSRWGTSLRLAVVHRTGRVAVGQAAVVIAVSSGHRAEAYEASRYVIEELKQRAPIWKKEHYEDGDTDWLQGHALCGHEVTP